MNSPSFETNSWFSIPFRLFCQPIKNSFAQSALCYPNVPTSCRSPKQFIGNYPLYDSLYFDAYKLRHRSRGPSGLPLIIISLQDVITNGAWLKCRNLSLGEPSHSKSRFLPSYVGANLIPSKYVLNATLLPVLLQSFVRVLILSSLTISLL